MSAKTPTALHPPAGNPSQNHHRRGPRALRHLLSIVGIAALRGAGTTAGGAAATAAVWWIHNR